MDGMESLLAGFSGLPYFSPFSCVNKSGTCGASRILQTRWMGCSTVTVEDKVRQEAAAPGPEQAAFRLKQAAIEAVAAAAKRSKLGTMYCVLWRWQICEGAASRACDWRDLVFCDATTKRWLVVQTSPIPGSSSEHQPAAMAQQAAQHGKQLFSLLRYIGYAPAWVRSCAFPSATVLPQGLLEEAPLPPERCIGCAQVDAASFQPALQPRILAKIDAILARDKSLAESIEEYRKEVRDAEGLTPQQLRQSVELPPDSEEGRAARAARAAAPRTVTFCKQCKQSAEEAGVQELLRCARCKIARYCSKDCQVADWKTHKLVCRSAEA